MALVVLAKEEGSGFRVIWVLGFLFGPVGFGRFGVGEFGWAFASLHGWRHLGL